MRFFYQPVANTYVVQIVTHTDETFRVEFTDSTRREAMRVLGKWAGNPDISLTWFQAAVMCNRIRHAECQGK